MFLKHFSESFMYTNSTFTITLEVQNYYSTNLGGQAQVAHACSPSY
jgi:hypothetical protein